RIRGTVSEGVPKPPNRTARLPRFDFVARPVGKVTHPLSMGAGAICCALEESRASAGAGPPNGLARGGLHSGYVVSIDFASRHPVDGAAIGHTWTSRGRCEWHLGGELVVFANEEHRQLPQAGEIQALVERSVVHRTVAKERDRDSIGLQEAKAVRRSGRLENA